MGICVAKTAKESADLPVRALLSKQSPAAIQDLSSLQECDSAQLLSIAPGSLRKLDARKIMQRLVQLREKN